MTMGTAAVVLVLQFATGVITARLLLPAGRGEMAAVVAWVTVLPRLVGLGFTSGISYFQARAPRPRPDAVALALLSVIGVSTVALVVAQLVAGPVFGARDGDLLDLARIGLIGVYPVAAFQVVSGELNSCGFYGVANALRAGQLVLYLAAIAAVAGLDVVSPGAVLAGQLASYAVVGTIGAGVLVVAVGWARPSRCLVTASNHYGVRTYGQTLGRIGNSQLDMMVLPAFVGTAQIGLYAIAVNVASIPVTLFEQVQNVTFRSAARRDDAERRRFIERMLRFITLGAAGITVMFLIVIEPLLELVYGPAFTGAAAPVRILMPGLVLWAANSVLTAALRSIGRPGIGSRHQLAGVALTVALLIVLLPRWGIEGAALASAIVYATVFAANARALGRLGQIGWRTTCSPAALRRDLAALARRRPTSRPGRWGR